MSERFVLLLFLVLIGCASCDVGVAQEVIPDSMLKPQLAAYGKPGYDEMISRGYQALFNGEDLTGWNNPYPFGEAQVVDGEIHLTSNKKFFLVTDRKYDNFRLSVEIKLPPGKANSGVMFRCHVDADAEKKVFGYQAECDGSDRRWSGGLYDEARRGWLWPSAQGRSPERFLQHEAESKKAFADPVVANALDRDGWNRFVITAIEDYISIEVNGVQTTSFRDSMDAEGFIAIQHHGEQGQTYRFRNLFIKQLPDVPAIGSAELVHQKPVAIERIDESTYLVDFGKVAFGNLETRIPDFGRGTASFHFGEKLKDGRVDRKPPGTVRYGETVVRADSGLHGAWIVAPPVDRRNTEQVGNARPHPPAVLTPSHWRPVIPFRWVEIEGWRGELGVDDLSRRAAFSSSWNDQASSFECSDETLNQIWELCKYSIKATTFAGVYVDGDRERIPYEADAYLNQLSHYYTDDDVEMAARTFDWLVENGTWPSEWAPHMVLMAHAEWIYSGDKEWLKQRFEILKSKTLLHRSGKDGLVRSGPMDQKRHDIVDWPKQERDGFVFTEVNTVVNAFHIVALERMAEMAAAIDNQHDADAFASRARLARKAFQEKLFDERTGIYRDGVGTEHSSVHANFFPLAFGLIPDDRKTGVVEWLKQNDMQCSVYAAQYFMEALFSNSAEQKALDLMTADGDRSWKHMVKSGTTISWEAWDLKYKPNQDWNHAWGAAPANLLPRFVLGAQAASPGWQSALIRPCPGNLAFARGKIPTPAGSIQVGWEQGHQFQLSLALPAGMLAKVELPATESSSEVTVNGNQVAATRENGRWILEDAVSGTVEIKSR